MSIEPRGHAPDELQFDRAVPLGPAGDRVACGGCGTPLTMEYHTVDSTPVCGSCRALAERAAVPVRDGRTLATAAVLGLGAAIAGAVVYYAVFSFFTQLSIVFIVAGYMVGTTVRKAARGRGGRRLQVLAVALTYVSIALSYLALTLATLLEAGAGGELGRVALLTLAFPVLVVVGSLPSGLITAMIMGFALMQAWRTADVPTPTIQGPFRLGTPAPEPEGAAA